MSGTIKGYTTFGKDGQVGSSGCMPEGIKYLHGLLDIR